MAFVTLLLAFAVVALIASAKWFVLFAHIAMADEQVEVFQSMCDKARCDDMAEAVACLKYTVNYYPSGTKQVAGSYSDRIVERCRELAIRDIINVLWSKSDRDYGDDPQNWIENVKEVQDSET